MKKKKGRRVAGLGWLERAHFVHDVQSKEPAVLHAVRRSLMRIRECMGDEQIGIDKGYKGIDELEAGSSIYTLATK